MLERHRRNFAFFLESGVTPFSDCLDRLKFLMCLDRDDFLLDAPTKNVFHDRAGLSDRPIFRHQLGVALFAFEGAEFTEIVIFAADGDDGTMTGFVIPIRQGGCFFGHGDASFHGQKRYMYRFSFPFLPHVRPPDGILTPDSACTYIKSGRLDLNQRPLRPENREEKGHLASKSAINKDFTAFLTSRKPLIP